MMAMNSYPASSVVPILFATYAGATGASVTLTGLAVTDIEIYKGTSMTQRASDAGYALLDTDGIDIDGITGIHGFSIDLGDNTDAGFYAVGSFYHVVVSAVTVDSQTVNFIADRFRIVAAEAVTGKPKVDVDAWLGTAAATPTVAGVPEVDVTHLGGAAQSATDLKDFADDGYDPATNKVQGVVLVDTLTTYTGNTVQTGDSFARLGAPAGASVSADIAAIEAQTDDIGAAGAGLTAIPWNAAWDAEVQSEVDDALVARNLHTLVIASGTADSGSTTTMVDAARTEGDADYWKGALLAFTSGTISGQVRIVTDFNAGTDTFTFAPATTQAVGTNTYVILPGISVWEDTLAEHLGTGTTGTALNSASSAGDPWNTALPGAYGAGTAGNIVGNNVDAAISSRMATYTQPSGFLAATFPGGTIANTTNITAGTVTTATNVTTVNGLAANVITAASMAADASAEIADAVWDEARAGHVAAGSFGEGVASVQGAVTGAVGSVTGAVGSVTGNVGGNVNGSVGSVAAGGIAAASFAAGAINAAAIATNAIDADALAADAVTEIQAGLSTVTTAQVNAEVVDALATDVYAEPGQGAPAATATLAAKINYLYKAFRNKVTQTSTTYSLFDDAGTTVDQKSVCSDDGTTLTRGEIVSGP